MAIFMVTFWVAVLVAAVLAIRWLALQVRPRTSVPEGDRALQILRERYARGEISKEEFEERKRDLTT